MKRDRTMARRRAVQALYQWHQSGADLGDIENQFLIDQDMSRADVGYFQDLLRGVPRCLDELDADLQPHLDRAISEVDPVERAILRLGVYELRHHLEVPYRVVINEAVDCAKVYGADQSHRYVNGVLDKIAKTIRNIEINDNLSR